MELVKTSSASNEAFLSILPLSLIREEEKVLEKFF